jgi:hypothetical protein
VLAEHTLVRQPLCLRSPDEVLVDRVQDVRAQHAAVKADEEHCQHPPGHQQVDEPLPRIVRERHIAAVRHERERMALGEHVTGDDPEPEDGHRDADEGRNGD